MEQRQRPGIIFLSEENFRDAVRRPARQIRFRHIHRARFGNWSAPRAAVQMRDNIRAEVKSRRSPGRARLEIAQKSFVLRDREIIEFAPERARLRNQAAADRALPFPSECGFCWGRRFVGRN